jgi:hypothetical protein
MTMAVCYRPNRLPLTDNNEGKPSVSSAATIPLSEYLGTSYRPDCDYLEGELLERNVGERDHSRSQTLLAAYLHCRELELG